MSWAGCQINPIDVNFHIQKSFEILDTNSADHTVGKPSADTGSLWSEA